MSQWSRACATASARDARCLRRLFVGWEELRPGRRRLRRSRNGSQFVHDTEWLVAKRHQRRSRDDSGSADRDRQTGDHRGTVSGRRRNRTTGPRGRVALALGRVMARHPCHIVHLGLGGNSRIARIAAADDHHCQKRGLKCDTAETTSDVHERESNCEAGWSKRDVDPRSNDRTPHCCTLSFVAREDAVYERPRSPSSRGPAAAAGSRTRNIAPPAGWFSTAIRPPCRSTIERTMTSPNPSPPIFVEKNDSNKCG